MKKVGKVAIKCKEYIRETAMQEYIADDGTKQYRELEKFPSYTFVTKIYDAYFSKKLGYGYYDGEMYHFAAISGSKKDCINFAKKYVNYPVFEHCDYDFVEEY